MSDSEGFGSSRDPDRPGFARPGAERPGSERPGAERPGASPEAANRPRPWPDLPPRSIDDRPGSSPPRTPGVAPGSSRRRRRRRGVALVVVLVLILAGLVVADRVGVQVAEQRVGAVLQSQLGTAQPADVSIPDVPFLTQAATGHFGEVRIGATDVPPADKSLALQRLDLNLHDVRTSSGYRHLQIARVDGTARFDYAALTASVGSTVSYAGKDATGRDRVQVLITTTVFNRSISASMTGPLSLDVAAQSVTLLDPQVQVAGVSLPAPISSEVAKAFLQPVAISGLPLGVKLSSLTAAPDGLSAGLAGENVTITTR